MRPSVRRGALAGAVLLVAVAAALTTAERGLTQAVEPPIGPLPLLGAADSATALIGAAPEGEPGEAWGYRRLPLSVGAVKVGSRELELGSVDPEAPEQQLVFLRHTDAAGWQIFDTPRDRAGDPYRGPVPNRLGARLTRGGGGVLVGRDPDRPADEQVVILHHDPGGEWRELEPPPDDVLLPAEALASDRGAGAVAVAAYDREAGTALLFGTTGPDAAEAIVSYEDGTWTREEVEIPVGSEGDFEILAIDATSGDNAWAIARGDGSLGRSFVLLQRVEQAGIRRWVERDPGGNPLASSSDPGAGLDLAAVAGGAAQPLTVTEDAVWVDLEITAGGVELSATVYYAIDSGSIERTWCDAPLCDAPLGVDLSRQTGYRSFAWSGSGFGTRVITNPLDPGGGEDSNRGTYLALAGEVFERMPGGGANFRRSGAFLSADEGWLEGPVEISGREAPAPLVRWPISSRAPFADVTTAPGAAPGSLGSGALAVGGDGSVARYDPARGWVREFLLTSVGAVNKSTLRGVAWPEANRAHAVGDLGAMWIWNADDDLWVADPGAPIGFEGNLMDVAFDPAAPERGYAVGRNGVLLSYGKSWEQEALPAGFEATNFTSIAFAGRQALVAAGSDLLVNDGSGWRIDTAARALLETAPERPQLFAVAALPDGGAVAAGRDVVIVRDSASGPWRYADQPLPGSTVIAAAATRPGGSGPVRPVVSVVPQITYPPADDLPDPNPDVPPPVLPAYPIAGDGYLLRESGSGWLDLQRTSFAGAGADRPLKSDPILSMQLGADGSGWAVGGWSGHADAAGRGSSASGSTGRTVRARVQTAMIARVGDRQAPADVSSSAPIPLDPGPVRLAVAGHAQCETSCVDLAPQGLGPDQTLLSALSEVAALNRRGGDGPRAFLYTGNRIESGLSYRDASRYAALLGAEPGLPVFAALGSSDVAGGTGAASFTGAFGGFGAPFGAGAPGAGIDPTGIPGSAPGPGARTHYAFDVSGSGGEIRVIVIDNSAGSLAASDPHQNPAEPQLPWLQAVLADAKEEGLPAIVMGNRSLNENFPPALNVASDARATARVLLEGGASAYVFDRPEENRIIRIPSGSEETIPSFGTGTLGYRSPVGGVVGSNQPDSLFGDSGFLMVEVDAAARDPETNRAPVDVRLIPVIKDLSLEATDGVLLRRSRPALFRGLGRRPFGGDRWGRPSAGTGTPDPAGGDPYTLFPPEQCMIAGCSARIEPEYTFTSSRPDIADFVRQDPASTNLRKPFIDENDKVVTDNSSGLLCPFNSGETTVTITAGGRSYSQDIRVLRGSVLRPCGTRPRHPGDFPPPDIPPPPPPPPPPSDLPGPPPPQPPAPTTPPAPQPPPAPTPVKAPLLAKALPPAVPPAIAPLPPDLASIGRVPVPPPPPPPPVGRPIPPGGTPARVFQVEEKREEELAPEESQAFSRFSLDDRSGFPGASVLLLVMAAAIAGAASVGGGGSDRREHRVRPAPGFASSARNRRRTP